MAEPGLSEIITAVQLRRRGLLRDNIKNNIPLYESLLENEGIEHYSGGRAIVEEVLFDENDTYQRYYGAQQLSTAYNPTMTAFEFDHKQIAIAVVINGREARINSGKEGQIKFAKARVTAAEYTFLNNFEADLFSDGTSDNGLQIGGLNLLVPKTPTAGTIGSIDRSTTGGAFARSLKFATTTDTTAPAPGGSATTAALVRAYYDYCINQTKRGGDRTKIILAGQSHYQFLDSALSAMQRTLKESKKVKGGYEELEYKGIPVYMVGGVNFGGQTYLAADRSYGINSKFLKLQVHEDADMEPLPEVHSINQEAKVKFMIWMGNMTVSAPKLQWTMYDS